MPDWSLSTLQSRYICRRCDDDRNVVKNKWEKCEWCVSFVASFEHKWQSYNDPWSSKIATRCVWACVFRQTNYVRPDTIVVIIIILLLSCASDTRGKMTSIRWIGARTSNRRKTSDGNNRNRKTDTQTRTVRQTENDRTPWMSFHSSKLLTVWMASEWRNAHTPTSTTFLLRMFCLQFSCAKRKIVGRVFETPSLSNLFLLPFAFCMHRKAHAHTQRQQRWKWRAQTKS